MGRPYLQGRNITKRNSETVRYRRRQLYPRVETMAKAMDLRWPKEKWTASRIRSIEKGTHQNIHHHLRYCQFLGFMVIAINSYENNSWTKETDRRSPDVRADQRASSQLGRLLLQPGEPGEQAGGQGAQGLGGPVQSRAPEGGVPELQTGPPQHRDDDGPGAQDVAREQGGDTEGPILEMDLPS